MTRSGSNVLMQRVLMLGAAAVLVTVAALGGHARALAHAEAERASPAIDSTIPEAPARVEVWFTQELFRRSGANMLDVTGADGASVVAGDPVIDDADRTHLSVDLAPNLEAGTYTVSWHSLSAVDGDEAEGSFTFTVDPDAAPTTPEPTAAVETTPTPAPTQVATPPPATVSTAGGGFPWWAVIAAAAVLAAGGLGTWTLRTPAGRDGEAP